MASPSQDSDGGGSTGGQRTGTNTGTNTGTGGTPGPVPVPSGTIPTPDPNNPRLQAVQVWQNIFDGLGLSDLGKEIGALVNDPSITQADLETRIYGLPSYKKYFPGMDALRKQGNVKKEGEYLSMEQSYRQLLANNNLPAGFYDTKQDFADWMVNNVAPNEIQARIDDAKRVLDSSDPSLRNAASQYYGLDSSHLMAYLLDPTKGQQVIDKQMRTMETGAAANRYGFQMDRAGAESLVNDPYASQMSQSQTESAMGQAADLFKTDNRLAQISGTQFSQQDAIDSVLRNNSDLRRKSAQLADSEASRFSGASAGRGALGRNSGV